MTHRRAAFPRIVALATVASLSAAACISCGAPPATAVVLPTFQITAVPEAGTTSGLVPTEALLADSASEAPPSNATPATAAGATPGFTVAVVVDTRSEPVTRDQAQAVINEASQHLRELTPVQLLMTDYVEDAAGGATTEMVQRYMVSRAGALPNGIVLFSFGDGGQAKQSGGYAFAVPAPSGFRNAFVSPSVGNGQIYVAVVQFSHKYMPCGYGGADASQSSTALDGECGNHPGTACVPQNGYSMCANAVGNLYMMTPTYFTSSTIIHELLHLFAPGGDKDNYSTPECTARMGYPAGFYDLQEAQYHNDLCPFVYEEFAKSYQP